MESESGCPRRTQFVPGPARAPFPTRPSPSRSWLYIVPRTRTNCRTKRHRGGERKPLEKHTSSTSLHYLSRLYEHSYRPHFRPKAGPARTYTEPVPSLITRTIIPGETSEGGRWRQRRQHCSPSESERAASTERKHHNVAVPRVSIKYNQIVLPRPCCPQR